MPTSKSSTSKSSKFSAGLKRAAGTGIFTLAQYMKLDELAREEGWQYSTVLYSDGRVKKVKNLGWLIRHSKEVESIVLIAASDAKHADGFMIVELYDWFRPATTAFYVSRWASFGHALDWLRRPSFDMDKITVIMPSAEHKLQIGTLEYKHFANKYYG